MKTNELRINNYIFDGKEIAEITSIQKDGNIGFIHNFGYGVQQITDFEPIPLTEEWLFKFRLNKNNGYPYKFLNGFIKIRNGNYFYKYYHLDIELKHVHQIQNLYFSLTGEELILKSI